jgi:putative ABC transport system ATP-binding protein
VLARFASGIPEHAGTETAVEAVGLVKRHRHGGGIVDAVRGISLSVARGEVVAVMGPSGSGKSTLLHLLGGLDVPDAGTVTIGGRALGGMSDDALTMLRRRSVGFVFQSYNLVPTLTAEENVALPLLLDGVAAREGRVRARDALAEVGMTARAEHPPDRLSGGEAQRVAVARAVVVMPAVVLADEPTGSLDSDAAAMVLALLCRAASARRAAVVMVTHDPRAAAHAQRVVRVADGAIVETISAPVGPRLASGRWLQ